MTTLLEAYNLSVGFGKQVVLSAVNLELEPGERVALVGANGSGKSTLLRTLAGLLPPLAGTLTWSGKPLATGPQRVRTLGVLLQNESSGPFSVQEQVAMGLALDGPPAPQDHETIKQALQRAHLMPLRHQPSDRLSGGETQRVRFARTGVAQPKVLLLDEPTNHLDPAHCAMLMQQLAGLSSQTAVVISTHDLSVAATCDRVLLLAQGLVFLEGKADEVLQEQPLQVALGARVQRVEDPRGGPPFFRVAEVGLRN